MYYDADLIFGLYSIFQVTSMLSFRDLGLVNHRTLWFG